MQCSRPLEKAETGGEGRGFLVTGFLEGTASAEEYMKTLSEDGKTYNPFNLVIFEPTAAKGMEKGYKVSYVCRGKPGHIVKDEGPVQLENGIALGVGNHPNSSPFLKTMSGKKKMAKVVADFGAEGGGKEDLLASLSKLLRDREQCWPDVQMQKQMKENVEDDDPTWATAKARSSIFVETADYGTRTHDFLLVDGEGNATFVEKTRRAAGSETPEWDDTRVDFKIRED